MNRFSLVEYSFLIGVSVMTLRRRIVAGELKVEKFNRKYFVNVSNTELDKIKNHPSYLNDKRAGIVGRSVQ